MTNITGRIKKLERDLNTGVKPLFAAENEAEADKVRGLYPDCRIVITGLPHNRYICGSDRGWLAKSQIGRTSVTERQI